MGAINLPERQERRTTLREVVLVDSSCGSCGRRNTKLYDRRTLQIHFCIRPTIIITAAQLLLLLLLVRHIIFNTQITTIGGLYSVRWTAALSAAAAVSLQLQEQLPRITALAIIALERLYYGIYTSSCGRRRWRWR